MVTTNELPRCEARHPDTGVQCARVFPPHEGYDHVGEDGSAWTEPAQEATP